MNPSYESVAMTDTHNHSPTDWEWANLIALRHMLGTLQRAREEPKLPVWRLWTPPKLEGGK